MYFTYLTVSFQTISTLSPPLVLCRSHNELIYFGSLKTPATCRVFFQPLDFCKYITYKIKDESQVQHQSKILNMLSYFSCSRVDLKMSCIFHCNRSTLEMQTKTTLLRRSQTGSLRTHPSVIAVILPAKKNAPRAKSTRVQINLPNHDIHESPFDDIDTCFGHLECC